MGIASKIAGFFTGNAGGKIIDVVDGAHLGAEERMNIDQKDLESARQYAISQGTSGYDIAVNCINRLMRPVTFFWLLGGLMGLYDFPDINRVPKFYQSLIWLAFSFIFGGRALMKDIPAFLGLLMKKK